MKVRLKHLKKEKLGEAQTPSSTPCRLHVLNHRDKGKPELSGRPDTTHRYTLKHTHRKS